MLIKNINIRLSLIVIHVVKAVGNRVLLNDKVVKAVGNRVLLNGKVSAVGNQVTVDVTTLQYHIY
jgi:hypothetical protein